MDRVVDKRRHNTGAGRRAVATVPDSAPVGRVDTTANADATDVLRHVSSMEQALRVADGGDPASAAGGDVDADLESRIQSSSGRPLGADIRAKMESGFGTDFGGVRVHENSDAAPRIGALAFTTGTDVHFAPGQYDPGSTGGQELLAHELTHVVQQTGGASRRADAGRIQAKMWPVKTFDSKTSQGRLTAKSTAQKTIRTLIANYLATVEAHGTVLNNDLSGAIALLKQMEEACGLWISYHTLENGTTNPDRAKRMAGMVEFRDFVRSEISTLKARYLALDGTSEELLNAAVAAKDDSAMEKVRAHYQCSAESGFRKLGALFDGAVPNDGDTAKLEIELQIPVDPSGSAFIGLHLVGELGRDAGKVKARLEVGVTAGGKIAGLGDLKGELGGYLEAQAASGADVAELMSYSMYRRARESAVMNDELTNFMWGGRADALGKDKAERWSKDLERRLFGVLDGMPREEDFSTREEFAAARRQFISDHRAEIDLLNEIYVESGGYGALSAKFGFASAAELEVAIKGFAGRRVDFLSLTNRKGGAGEDNLGSDSVFNLTGRTQKRTGRDMAGWEAEAKVSSGPIVGKLKLSKVRGSDGVREIDGGPSGSWDPYSLEVSGQGKMPVTQMVGGGLGPFVGEYVAVLARTVRSIAQSQNGAAQAGSALQGTESAIAGLSQIAHIPQQQWKPRFAIDQPTPGELTGSATIGFGLKITKQGSRWTFAITHHKDASIELPSTFKIALERSERLLRFVYDGTAWSVD